MNYLKFLGGLLVAIALFSNPLSAMRCGHFGNIREIPEGGFYAVQDCWCKTCTTWYTDDLSLVRTWCSNAGADEAC